VRTDHRRLGRPISTESAWPSVPKLPAKMMHAGPFGLSARTLSRRSFTFDELAQFAAEADVDEIESIAPIVITERNVAKSRLKPLADPAAERILELVWCVSSGLGQQSS